MLKSKIFITIFTGIAFISLHSFAQAPKKIRTIIVDAGHGGEDGGAHGAYEGGLYSWEKNVTLAISLKLVAELQKELPDVKIIPTRTTDIYQSPPDKADIANANKGDLFICIHADAVALKEGRRQIGTHVEIRHTIYYVGKGRKRKKMIKSKSVVVPTYEYYKIGCPQRGTSVWIFAAHKTSQKWETIMKNTDFDIGEGEDSSLNKQDFSVGDGKIIANIYAKRYQDRSIKLANLVNDEIAQTGRPALGTNQRQKGIWVLQATNMPAVLIETGFITNDDDERYLNSEKGQQELAESISKAVKRYKEQLENPQFSSESTPDSTGAQKTKQ